MKLLKPVCEVKVRGTKKFVARNAFGPNNPAGIEFNLDYYFAQNFLGKTEKNVKPATIQIYRLGSSCGPKIWGPEIWAKPFEIKAELGKKQVIKLAHLYKLIEAQANDQEGPLLVNGYVNIAFIEDRNGDLWTVLAYRPPLIKGIWEVMAQSDQHPIEFHEGNKVLPYK